MCLPVQAGAAFQGHQMQHAVYHQGHQTPPPASYNKEEKLTKMQFEQVNNFLTKAATLVAVETTECFHSGQQQQKKHLHENIFISQRNAVLFCYYCKMVTMKTLYR